MAVYDTLVNAYGSGNVSRSNYNGNDVCVINLGGAQAVVPNNLQSQTYVVSYTPGIGDTSTNRSLVQQYFSNNGMNNAILVIDNSCNSSRNNTELAYDLAKFLGSEPVGAITSGFSYTGSSSINEAAQFNRNHPDIPTVCLSIDGTTSKPHLYYEGSPGDAYGGVNPTGTNKNFSIVLVDGQFSHASQAAKYTNSGINAVNLSFTTENYTDNGLNCHDGASIDAMQFIIPYILGNADAITSKKNYYLIDGNGNSADMSLLRDAIGGVTVTTEVVTLENEVQVPDESKDADNGKFTVTLSDSDIKSKYSKFSTIGDLKLDGLKSTSSKYVASDLQYVCNTMNAIRASIKSNSTASSLKQLNLRSTSGIPGCLSGYINAYLDLAGSLYEKMVDQTEAVVSYAQCIVDMDKDLNNVFEVNNVNPTLNAESGSVPTGGNTGGGTPSNAGTYAAIGLGAGAGAYYSGGGGTPTVSNPVTNTKPNEDVHAAVESEMAYLCEDGHRVVVDQYGGKIRSLKLEYEFKAGDDFDACIKKIYASVKNPDMIEKIELVGNKILVTFKQSYVDGLSPQQVQEYYVGGVSNV